jgi:hypothetical protein
MRNNHFFEAGLCPGTPPGGMHSFIGGHKSISFIPFWLILKVFYK